MLFGKKRFIDAADPKEVDQFNRDFRPTIPLDRAILCLDCDSLFEAGGSQRCPACGSSVGWPIGRKFQRGATNAS